MTKLKISKAEINKFYIGSDFPKYTTQIINLVNNTAQATRPSVVGQMSDLVSEFRKSAKGNEDTLLEWKKWYLKRYPESIELATSKIYDMLQNYVDAMRKINRIMIRRWVEDLVIYKSYKGIKYQEIALHKVADFCKKDFRGASSQEESKGIDGFVGEEPVQVKKKDGSYHVMIDIHKPKFTLITYSENKDGSVSIEFDESKILN